MAKQMSGAENGEMPHQSEGPLLHAEQHEDGNGSEHSPSATTTTTTHALTTTSYLPAAGNPSEEPVQGVSVKQEGVQQRENEDHDDVDGNKWSYLAKQPATVKAADTKSKTDSMAGDKHPSMSNLSKSGIRKKRHPIGSSSHFSQAFILKLDGLLKRQLQRRRRLQREVHRLQQSRRLDELRSEHVSKDDDEAPHNDMAMEESPGGPYQWPVPSESEKWKTMQSASQFCASPQFGRGIELSVWPYGGGIAPQFGLGIERYTTTKLSEAEERGIIEPEGPPQLNEEPDKFPQLTEMISEDAKGKSFLM